MQRTGPLSQILLYCSAGLEANTGYMGRMAAIVGWRGRGSIGLRACE